VNRRRWIWGGLAGVGLVAELVSLRRHDGATLSETARAVFATHTPAGRLAFVGAWAALTVFLVPHICKLVELVDEAHDIEGEER
jgi:hypothetical protein